MTEEMFDKLFLEHIGELPDYPSVSGTDIGNNEQKLKEVCPKAENLKTKLVHQYQKDNEECQEDEVPLEDTEVKRRKKDIQEEEERELEEKNVPIPKENGTHILNPPDVVPNVPTDNIIIPKTFDSEKEEVPQKPDSCLITHAQPLQTPAVDRSTKADSLLSTSLHFKTGLRKMIVPSKLMGEFLNLARTNTVMNIETCGILAGKLDQNQLIITHLLVPKQSGTADSCTTRKEEEIVYYHDAHDLITLGWIHTHPSQPSFLSSVDLHTHYSYQLMMPEAIAIVCAPRYQKNGLYVLTRHLGMETIGRCQKTGFHYHPKEAALFMKAQHCKFDKNADLKVVDLRKMKKQK